MSYGSHSDEVAEDYRKALEDLTMNSRYEISNLTVIAKENTEHAPAISEALRDHIKTTPPAKKLPALYVLDSVVKNVGTPYTLYFGRQLYSTFMEAYALVDNNVRRKMEEMLKTWKEPVPGSRDIHPVFPLEVTRPIENALLKARTSALEAQREYARSQSQQLMRGRPNVAPVPYRNTPTPPNVIRQSPYPGPVYETAYAQGYPSNPIPQRYGDLDQRAYGTPPVGRNFINHHDVSGDSFQLQPQSHQPYSMPPSTTPAWQQPPQAGYRDSDASIDSLISDIENLVTATKAEFAQNPHDASVQTRLKALLDLQSILRNQTLPKEQLALIRDQVAQLSIVTRPPKLSTPIPTPIPVVAALPPQPPAQQPSLSSLLGGPEALKALLARSSATPQAPTPPLPAAVPHIRSPPPQNIPQQYPPATAKLPVAVGNPLSLVERLRAAGVLPPIPASAATPPVSQSPIPIGLPPAIPPQLPFNLPIISNNARLPLGEIPIPNDIQLKPTSLKIPHPHLISMLYERLGAPCTQCGRRFQADEEGKKKKAAHMDWHFHVNKRMADAEKRGQQRSWYVDELDWIKSRETQDDQLPNATNGSATGAATEGTTASKGPKLQYLPVPDDPALANSLCPICQERFEMKWLDDAQEFVWMDAVKIGDRIYHASCHAEAKRDGGGNTPAFGRGTPEPVLGKRKIEDDSVLARTKIKTEPV